MFCKWLHSGKLQPCLQVLDYALYYKIFLEVAKNLAYYNTATITTVIFYYNP